MRRFACSRLSSYIQTEFQVYVDLCLADALFVLLCSLSLTTTVCDEARGWPPNVTDDDQAHVNPHPVARSVPVRDSLLQSLWEPLLLSSLLCTSDMRQISTSVPVQFKYLSQTPSHRTVQPLVFPELFYVQSQSDPACSSSIILSLSPSQHLSILSSTYPPQLATRCVCIVVQVSFQPRFVFSESHSLDCCSDMQYPAVRLRTFQRKTSM